MHLALPPTLLALLALLQPTVAAPTSNSAPKATQKPCTLHSPSTGAFFDLRPLQNHPSDPSIPLPAGATPPESWHARGHDYPANFTLNICGPVVEDLEDVVGVPSSRWQNVSAFYRSPGDDEIYSIGQMSADPIFRGKKLVLNYTDGSPCPDIDDVPSPKGDKNDDDNDEDDETPNPSAAAANPTPPRRRKSTLLSFLCDRDPSLTTHPLISFVGTMDQCTYFFEVRSRYACGGVTTSEETGNLGPGGVFGVILGIAVMAYLVGGCAYQRTVMHQRGWRQCPNFSVWAGVCGFVLVSSPIFGLALGVIMWHIFLAVYNQKYFSGHHRSSVHVYPLYIVHRLHPVGHRSWQSCSHTKSGPFISLLNPSQRQSELTRCPGYLYNPLLVLHVPDAIAATTL